MQLIHVTCIQLTLQLTLPAHLLVNLLIQAAHDGQSGHHRSVRAKCPLPASRHLPSVHRVKYRLMDALRIQSGQLRQLQDLSLGLVVAALSHLLVRQLVGVDRLELAVPPASLGVADFRHRILAVSLPLRLGRRLRPVAVLGAARALASIQVLLHLSRILQILSVV